jgi:ABC-2 type transport system ATP-binding protein
MGCGDQAVTAVVAAGEPDALSVVDVSFRFPGRLALDGVSLQVPQGQFRVLLGPNGAGKTTLFSLITRLYATRDGSVSILGHDVDGESCAALSSIGTVFQQPTLDLDLSVRQNLGYHAALHGLPPRKARARIERELGRGDLLARADERVRNLSGGQRRRVELSRALLHQPRLLLMDEPTVGLDIHSRQAMIDHVRALCRDDGVAVLWATHLVDEIQDGDHLVVLHRGKVRVAGTVAEVLNRAAVGSVQEAFSVFTRDTAA